MCRRFFDNKVLEQHTMFYDDTQHSFCSKSCQNIYIIANRRIVPCSWCKVKKYNFDMIRRFCSSGQVLMMCSLNCLSLYQVSINAVNLKKYVFCYLSFLVLRFILFQDKVRPVSEECSANVPFDDVRCHNTQLLCIRLCHDLPESVF